MRFLFTTWAWPSHLYALVPLAWACRLAGHEVLFVSQPGLLPDIRRTGLPAVSIGTDVDTVGMVREYLLPLEGPTPPPGNGAPRALRMLLAHAESMTGDLVELVRAWRADLVVYDQTALAGPLAAAAAGIPAVRHLYGVDLMLRARSLLPDALAPLAEVHGAAGFDAFGAATVDPVPASLQTVGDHRRIPMRYIPFNGSGALPRSLGDTGDRLRVCVSWGHTIAKVEPARFLAGWLASALRDADVDVVLAITSAQRTLIGQPPDGARVVLDAPLWHVLSTSDMLVGHGGAGSVLTALDRGLPMLLVPQLPDHAGHSARVADRGAGVVLEPDALSHSTVREHIERMLGDSPERKAARALREEMREQPTPSAVVSELESLCR
ncbi:nucleotide disphospho-sugar-binding domain-containing protein [Kibdelosporangium persicum]|uniref:Desosaminyl transferase EryCIII n=1 Tax=Kibdelosporangium persicum TaxID=2698649 RepID=A0ABX2FI15_9PSEU|nr:nucleotide disphospho-sugar-binding domain-containing protein [Kibdelosporangium persicum]NRN71031.1 Desosaminyl transferase EryCIII [Kibdelosporangium persicum]